MSRDEATQRQIDSADPQHSTWLSANAGSGKTRVLTDRVARLLCDGVSPQNILCLTYTKAAASEMQNRLFKRLGEWSMKTDANLRKDLDALGIPDSGDPADLAHARTLFARALETPGGLKIQTIHSFCSSLLRRFPLEAGVSPFFKELDERGSEKLREDVLENIANGPGADVVKEIAVHFTGEDFSDLTQEIVKHQQPLSAAPRKATVWQQAGLSAGYDLHQLMSETFQGDEIALLRDLVSALRQSSAKTEPALAEKLAVMVGEHPTPALLDFLISMLLLGPGAKTPYAAKIDQFPTKAVRENNPDLSARLNDLMVRVETARENRNRLHAAERTFALRNFASLYLDAYAAQKLNRGVLDFDDLILKARDLLVSPAVAQWVLFRLDGGIDHILVDEAQDTSPLQWQVIRLLAQEFGAGIGANPNLNRTIFVVGDLKQSIYSFQGADPKSFHEMQHHFDEQLGQIGLSLQQQALEYSFRSSPAILGLVDATFAHLNSPGIGAKPRHRAFQAALPGRVDLWPAIEKADKPEEKEWYDPTDKLTTNDPRIILARQIADQIANMIDTELLPEKDGTSRRVRAGDFLILVQRRSDLFHEIIRACKNKNLPIAGADRLKIGAELAVKDISAVLSFLALPDDDLSLAAALRSPLFGLSEKQLFDLAHDRKERCLWPALSRRRDEFPEVFEILNDLRNRSDFLSPFALIERLLTRHAGRKKLLARLGQEAEEGIDALVSQALNYEYTETPSLTGFITWLEAEDVQIKRQAESAGDRIRVMTTHGAKGLEAPIVILPDTAAPRSSLRSEVLLDDQGLPLWKSKAEMQDETQKSVVASHMTAQEEERHRLLYVALTRAEKWLIVCGAGDMGDANRSWYGLVQKGMELAGAEQVLVADEWIYRLQNGDWPTDVKQPTAEIHKAVVALPDWATTDADLPDRLPQSISPSDLPGPKFLMDEAEGLSAEEAKQRGTEIHRLLEVLPTFPQHEWAALAASLMQKSAFHGEPDAIRAIVDETIAVLRAPHLAHVFSADTLAEVDISAHLPAKDALHLRGTIDRLLIGPERVVCVDFKSNSVVPSSAELVPQGLVNQMAAYHFALSKIFPGKVIEVMILWTRTATLMALPHDIVRNASILPATS